MGAPGPRDRLVATAIDLIRQNGVEATGLNELVAASGAARRSIYQHFPAGKLELIETSTRVAGDWMGRVLASAPGVSPREAVRGFLDGLRAGLVADGYVSGCPIAAAAMAPRAAAGVRAAATDVFEAWTDGIAAELVEAGARPDRARSLAGFAVSAVEGALMRAIAARSDEPLVQAAEQLDHLLAAALEQPPE